LEEERRTKGSQRNETTTRLSELRESLLTFNASIGVKVILKQAEAAEAPIVLTSTGRSTDSRRAMIPALACAKDENETELSFREKCEEGEGSGNGTHGSISESRKRTLEESSSEPCVVAREPSIVPEEIKG